MGLALADSSIVTLALPEILRAFDVGVVTVAWVLTSYNLVLAAAAVPAALLARRRPREAFAGGAVVFALASLACGLAGSFAVLVAARSAQALGGALLVTAALALLAAAERSDEGAARLWAAAGVLGAAVGPAVGGIVTQLIGWEWIFLLQAPLALVPLAALVGLAGIAQAPDPGRPHLGANATLLLLSGGLVAALFLLVLLLVDGWGMSPAAAGLVVTLMPVAAIAAARLASRAGSVTIRAATGIVLVGGGLACLAFLPRAGWWWTVAPQLLVGAGLGLSVAALTERALHGRAAHVVHGGWTIASRHAGVVLGLLLLAPVFAAALDRNEAEALRAGTAAVLDSDVAPLDKLRVAQDVLDQVDRADGSLPDLAAAFADRPDSPAYRSLLATLEDQLERAVTSAFSRPFLLAAGLAFAALLPLLLARRERGL